MSSISTSLPVESIPHYNHSPLTCHICLKSVDPAFIITLSCTHSFCKVCLKSDLEIKISEAKVHESDLICPIDYAPIDTPTIRSLVSDQSFEKFQRFCLQVRIPVLSDNEIYWPCPGVDCINRVVLLKSTLEFECSFCRTKSCTRCNEVVHERISCEAFRKWKEENAKGDEMLEALIRQNQWMRCPWCAIVVERIDGCQFMTCRSSNCKAQKFFCYVCKRALNSDHEPHTC